MSTPSVGTPLTTESRKEVREVRWSSEFTLGDVLRQVSGTRMTGTLFVDFNQGGIGSIRFRIEQRLPIPEESS